MKIRKQLSIILLSACLSQSLAISSTANDTQPTNPNASNNMASKDDLSAQKELFQLQLDAKKELLQNDIEAQSKRIDGFDKRLNDQTSRISDIGSQVERFGILITVLFVVAGFLGYRTAKNDAKETAKEAASQWFNDNHIALNSKIKELENRATQASETIDGHEDKVAQKSSAVHATIEALEEAAQAQMQIIQNQMSQDRTEGKSENQSPKDNSAIERKAEQLKQLPETEYTFFDWNTRAFASYSESKFEDAIFYWNKAISASDIQPHTEAQAMYNKGVALGQLNRDEEAIAAYDAIITKFGTAKELNLREQVAIAMVNKGATLTQLNRNEEAVVAYETAMSEFSTATQLSLREKVAATMINKGVTLSRLNRGEEAIAAFEAVIGEFATAKELSSREKVVAAMINKGVALGRLNRGEEEIAVYDAIITQFITAEDLNLREQVAKAMVNKSITLGKLNRGEEEIVVYDAIITQFGTAEELNLREPVAKAMVNKGVTLSKLNRAEEAITAYDAVIIQFGTAEELSLREEVATAMSNKGFSLLCKAKANWENMALAKELLVNANNTCNLSILKKSGNGLAYGNLAYITWLQGDAVAAEQHFKTGLAAATNEGEELYKATLTDLEIHPIAPDQGFRELVDKLWGEYQQSHIS